MPLATRKSLTFKLLIQSSSAGDAQCANELFEIDRAVLVIVKHIKHIVGKLAWVAKREELLVYPRKLVLVELSAGTVFEEPFVPRTWLDRVEIVCRDISTIAVIPSCRLRNHS